MGTVSVLLAIIPVPDVLGTPDEEQRAAPLLQDFHAFVLIALHFLLVEIK